MAKRLNYQVDFSADTASLRKTLDSLNAQLAKIGSTPISMVNTANLREGVTAARDLQKYVKMSVDTKTGALDLSRFNQTLRDAGVDAKTLSQQLVNLGPAGQSAFKTFASSVAQAQTPIKRTNAMLNEMWVTLKNTARWQLTASIMNSFVGAIQTAVGYAKDLNRSLNDIQIVTGLSSNKMADFAVQANEAAKALNTNTVAYTDAALIYYQQGLSTDEVLKRTDITIKAANAAGTSAERMSEYLTAVWNSYSVGSDQLEHTVDVMAKLGAATASSLEEISTGMQKVAATANTLGVSLEQMSAILATVGSVTRESPETIGTAYKTIIARMGDLKLGKTDEDGVGLGNVSGQLSKIGVSILDATGNLKDMGSVIEEVGSKWQDMSAATKDAVAQVLAGKRQYTQLMALFENWDMYKENLATAMNSDGQLEIMADTYAESWSAARQRVRASLEGIYSDVLDDKLIVGFTNVISEALSGIDDLIDHMGGFGTVLLGIAATITSKFKNQIIGGFRNVAVNVKNNLGITEKETVQLENSVLATARALEGEDQVARGLTTSLEATIQAKRQLRQASKMATDAEMEYYESVMQSIHANNEFIRSEQEKINASSQASNQIVQRLTNAAQRRGNETSASDIAMLMQRGVAANTALNQEKNVQSSMAVLKNLSTALRNADQGAEGFDKKLKTAISDAQKILEVMKLNETLMNRLGNVKVNREMGAGLTAIEGLLNGSITSAEGFAQAVNTIQQALNNMRNSAMKDLNGVENSLSNLTRNSELVTTAMNNIGKQAESNALAVRAAMTNMFDTDALINRLKAQTQSASSQILGLVGSMGQLYFAYQTLTSLPEMWSDEDVSGLELVLSILMSMSFVIPTLTSVFGELKNIIEAKATASAADALATEAQAEAATRAATAEAGLTEAELSDTAATNGLTGAKARLTAALSTSAAKAGLLMLAITALIGVVSLVVDKFREWYVSAEEAAEAIDESAEKYDNAKKEIDEVSSELEKVRDRIQEINSQDTLTIADQEELNQLHAQEASLERQLQIKERLAELAAQQAINEAIVTEHQGQTNFEKELGEIQDTSVHQFGLKNSDNEDIVVKNLPKDNPWTTYDQISQATANQWRQIADWLLKGDEEQKKQGQEILNTLETTYDELKNEKQNENLEAYSNALTDLVNLIGAYDTLGKEYDANFYKALDQMTAANKKQYADKEDYYEVLIKPVLDDEEVSKNRDKLLKAYDEIGSDLSDMTEQEIVKQLAGAGVANLDEIQDIAYMQGVTLKEVLEGIGQEYDGVMDKFKQAANTADVDLSKMDKLTYDEIEELYNAVADKENFFELIQSKLQPGAFIGDNAKQNYAEQLRQAMLGYDYNNLMDDFNFDSADNQDVLAKMLGVDTPEGLKEKGAESAESYVQGFLDQLEQEGNISATGLGLLLGDDSNSDQIKQAIQSQFAELSDEDKKLFLKLDWDEESLQAARYNLKATLDEMREEAETQEVEAKLRTEFESKGLDATVDEAKKLAKHYQQIAKTSDDVNDELAENDSMALELAGDVIEMNEGLGDLIDNWEDWSDVLKDSDNMSLEYVQTLESVRDAVGKILNISDTSLLSDGFLTAADNVALLGQAAQGSGEAIDELRLRAGQEILVNITSELNTEGLDLDLEWFDQRIREYEATHTMTFGATVDDTEFINRLNEMAETLGMSVPQMQNYLNSLGYEADLETKKIPSQVEHTIEIPVPSVTWNGLLPELSVKHVPLHFMETTYVDIPQIKAMHYQGAGPKTISAGNKASGAKKNGGGSKKSSGGGGGGKKGSGGSGSSGSAKEIQKKDHKEVDDEIERYHYLLQTIDNLNRALDETNKKKELAFGRKKLEYIQKEIDAADKLIAKQKEYIAAVEAQNNIDRANIEGYGFTFDEDGELINYQEVSEKQLAILNAAVDTFNVTGDEDAYEAAEKAYEQFTDYRDKYVENNDELQQAREDLLQMEIDQATRDLENIQTKVEINVELNEDDLDKLEYYLSVLENDTYTIAKQIANLGDQSEDLLKNMSHYSDGIAEIMRKMQDQDGQLTSEQWDTILDYRDNLMEIMSKLQDLNQDVENSLADAIDEANEKLEKQIDLFDTYESTLEHFQDILEITGRQLSNPQLVRGLSEKQFGNAINNLAGYKDASDMANATYERIMQAYNNAMEQGMDEDTIKFWQEQLTEAEIAVKEAAEEMNQAWYDALDRAREDFELAITQAIQTLEDALSPLRTLDEFQTVYDRAKTIRDQYLSTERQAYELNKLNRDIQDDLDESKNVQNKEKLLELQQDINELQESGAQMSEYDLEYLQKRYELLQAEAALEEAQQNKSTMRLSRDESGNWNYVYTQDTSALDEQQQSYEDKLYELQELSQNYIDDLSDQIIQNEIEMAETLEEIMTGEYDSEEERAAALAAAKEYYGERDRYLRDEYMKALENMGKAYEDTTFGQIENLGNMNNAHENFVNNMNAGIAQMMSDWDTWQEHIRIAAETAGYTYETFVEGIQANSDVIREDSDLTRAQIEYDTMQMEGYIDQVIGSVEDWKFSWVGEMDVMIDKTLELINMIDALRSAMTGEQYDSTIDYSIKMAESYARGDAGAALRYADLREQKIVGDNMTQEQWQDTTEYLRDLFVRGFSLGDADALAEAVERGFGNVVEQFRRITGLRSGGYTGEWGQSNGRLAILHQKELVLNPEDTQNFLSATYLLRDVMGAAGDGLAEKAKAMSSLAGLAAPVYNGSDNVVQQVVSIDASFPGVQSAIEIENALNNLVNEASQYAAVKTL